MYRIKEQTHFTYIHIQGVLF